MSHLQNDSEDQRHRQWDLSWFQFGLVSAAVVEHTFTEVQVLYLIIALNYFARFLPYQRHSAFSYECFFGRLRKTLNLLITKKTKTYSALIYISQAVLICCVWY